MKTFKIKFFAMNLLMILSIFSCKKETSGKSDDGNQNTNQNFGFISRSVDKLMDGDKEFRFIGMNTPNLTVVEDNSWSSKGWHRVDTFEIRDAFKTIKLMGGTVTRTYVFSVHGGVANPNGISHIYSPGNYDENLFKDFDYVLKLANEYKVRLIVPFIDNWNWWGGTTTFAAFENKKQSDFCTDSLVVKDFKNFIAYVLNRTNTYTGVQYKNDPAILAWETGNELGPENSGGNINYLDSWTNEISTFTKSIDKNHLVQDGKDSYRYGMSEAQLNNPNVDIVTDHYYWGDYVNSCNNSRNRCKGKKVFYVGEFNSSSASVHEDLLQNVIVNGSSGALVWSLRFHTKDGGFYYHGAPNDPNNSCYRWPGFSSATSTNEATKMKQIRMYAYVIQGLDEPAISIPDAPVMIDGITPDQLRWKGSAGASSYILERSADLNGPWTEVDSKVTDADIPYSPYNDATATSGTKYYYRVKAQNSSGISVASNTIGPISK